MKNSKLARSEYAKLKVGKVRTFSDTVKPTLLRLRFSFLAWSQYDEHGDDDEVDFSYKVFDDKATMETMALMASAVASSPLGLTTTLLPRYLETRVIQGTH